MLWKISKGSTIRHTFFVAIATGLLGTLFSFGSDLINRIFHSHITQKGTDTATMLTMFAVIIGIEIMEYVWSGNKHAYFNNKFIDTIYDLTVGTLTIILVTKIL